MSASSKKRWAALSVLAVAGLGGALIAQPWVIREGSVRNGDGAAQSAGNRSLKIGKFVFVADEWPLIGTLGSGGQLAAVIHDYTCGHCYELKHQALEAVAKRNESLAVLLLPGYRSKPGRELQRQMQVLFLADRKIHALVEGQLEGNDTMVQDPEALRAVIEGTVGEAQWKEALAKYGDQADERLAMIDALIESNAEKVGGRSLPQWIARGEVYVGVRGNVDQLLSEVDGVEDREKGLQFECPLTNFGEVVAGGIANLAVRIANRSDQPLEPGGWKLPEGVELIRAPAGPVPPGGTAHALLRWHVPMRAGIYQGVVELLGERPCASMVLVADVWKPIDLSQKELVLSRSADGPWHTAEPIRVTLTEKVQVRAEVREDWKVTLIALEDGLNFELAVMSANEGVDEPPPSIVTLLIDGGSSARPTATVLVPIRLRTDQSASALVPTPTPALTSLK